LLRPKTSIFPPATVSLPVFSPEIIPLYLSRVRFFKASQLVLRCLASSAVKELLLLCNPFSMADNIFCVLLSARNVCTSTDGDGSTLVVETGARNWSEAIFFDVSERFSPDDARRKFLYCQRFLFCPYREVSYACCIFSLSVPPTRRRISSAFSLIIR